jgi:hypothetical protein
MAVYFLESKRVCEPIPGQKERSLAIIIVKGFYYEEKGSLYANWCIVGKCDVSFVIMRWSRK